MKILEINKFYFIKGGAERHFFDVTNLLQQAGHQVAVFSMHHQKNHKSKWDKYFLSTVGYDSSYTILQRIRGVLRMFYSQEAKKKINLLLDDFQPDIVHIHNIYHQLSPIILFEIKKRGIPIVMTVHDYKLINPNYNLYYQDKFYNRCLNRKFYQCFFDRCLKNSYLKSFIGVLEMYWHNWLGTYEKNIDLYIAPSKFARDILIERGMDKNNLVTLPHFIFDRKDDFLKRGTKIMEGGNKTVIKEKFCLYIGRVTENKGLEGLIDIFNQIDNIKLYVAGQIDNDFKISNKRNIEFLGHLATKKLIKYIRSSEFVISPSQLPETFGLIIIEANIQGKPFVGYKTGAFSEIIEEGVNGLLVDDVSQLLLVIQHIATKKYRFSKYRIKEDAYAKYNSITYLNQLTKMLKGVIIKNSIKLK